MFDYKKVPVKVQARSGFDKNHFNLFTSKVGRITPILVDELIPNTTVHLKAALTAALPPLASDTFMRCKLKFAAFFVPHRIIMPGFERWIVRDEAVGNYRITTSIMRANTDSLQEPDASALKARLYPGSLADFLGCKLTSASVDALFQANNSISFSALPFLAYHRIYEDWFRRSLVQKSIYSDSLFTGHLGGTSIKASMSNVWVPNTKGAAYYTFDPTAVNVAASQSCFYNDGVHLMDFRQANFDFDLFTTATPEAQDGSAQQVQVDSQSKFTISALRAANSIQQYLERQNLCGERYVDYVRGMYGAHLSDGIAQRSVLLGSGDIDVYSKGIYQTNEADSRPSTSNNPFVGVGTEFGKASIDGQSYLIDNFTAAEHGYLMVVCWLSPRPTYSTGISQLLQRYVSVGSQGNVANHILQNVGNEPIYQRQVNDLKAVVSSNDVFGYQERFYAWKDMIDEVHGLLRDGQSLESFACQRTFSAATGSQINSAFLAIPESYLDQVAAVEDTISDYGYWCDCFFDYKVSMPLAKYSLPSLQDPAYEHGNTEMMSRGGTSIA